MRPSRQKQRQGKKKRPPATQGSPTARRSARIASENMSKNKPPAPRARPLTNAIRSFALQDAPGHLLRGWHQRSEELFTAAVGSDGPTRQQIALLVTACQHPEASQAELVSLTGIDKNTLAEMIGRLTRRGLLERRRGAHDARTN